MRRAIVLGLDSATWPILQVFMDRGLMPNLQQAKDRMATATLTSCDPPVTVPAWRVMMSGTDPGRLGVFGFFVQEGDRVSQSYLLHPQAPTVQGLLRQHGLGSIVINMPLTDPGDRRDPWLASFVSPFKETYWPPDLHERVPEVSTYLSHHADESLELPLHLEDTLRVEERRIEVSQALFESPAYAGWSLFFTMLSGPDWVNHKVLHRILEGDIDPAVSRLYQRIDSFFGWLLDRLRDDDLLLVVSDHGSQSSSEVMFLNRWLSDQGYLHWKFGAPPSPVLHPTYRGRERKVHIPAWLNAGIRRLGLNRTLGPLARRFGLRPTERYHVDVGRSRAYMGNYSTWPELFVPDKSLIPELVARLTALRHPTSGERMFLRVLAGSEVYGCDAPTGAPDVILTPRADVGVMNDFSAQWLQRRVRNDHAREGMLGVIGKTVAQRDFGVVPILDVAPTLLSWLGIEKSPLMSGRSLLSPTPARVDPQAAVRSRIAAMVHEQVRRRT